MCGIVGVIGSRAATPLLLDSLRRLEYRGYDSAGIATLVNGHIDRRRAEGKLGNLAAVIEHNPLSGTTGIGHTRWATHGVPNETNAHPHGTSRVSIVHNGIIENHAELRAELEAAGQEFSTETDTETVAQLVDLHLQQGMDPVSAAGAAFRRLEGAYALAMIFAGHPELIVGAQHGAPLAVGYGENEMFVGSDALALAPLTRRIAYLKDGDWAVVDRQGARFFGLDGEPVERVVKQTRQTGASIGKGNYRHFMEKELHEHPAVIGDTLHQMVNPATRAVALPSLPFDFATVPRITISACGSAFYAGLVGRWWFEAVARIPTDGDVASEFRYRTPPMTPGGLGILVSQSGETADTMAALRYMREQGQSVLSVVNVPESSMARESDAVLETVAGPEIGVASTKAFTAQLSVLACLALAAARARGAITAAQEAAMTDALLEVPSRAAEILERDEEIQELAVRIALARDVLFLGRGNCYPIALEGALKLKEISYIHAEGYAAGEMKHGPIALIDKDVPVIATVPSGPLFEKTASNLQEAAARGGKLNENTDAI
jgi:glucosamine--fructose-6-phosphate aminotransferase (isomerizing)